IDYFGALLFASPVIYKCQINGSEVEPPDWLGQLKDDADGVGTDLVEFLRLRIIDAMIRRRGLWMLEYPETYGTAQSKADAERDGGVNLKLSAVLAEQVIDCARDQRGRLLWAIVHTVDRPRETPDSTRGPRLHTWHVLERHRSRVYQVLCEGETPDP